MGSSLNQGPLLGFFSGSVLGILKGIYKGFYKGTIRVIL